MNAKTYRPVIIKTLKDANTNKPANLEALADRIVENMGVFDEMFALAGGSESLVQSSASNMKLDQNYRFGQPASTQQFDISQRIVPDVEQTFSVEEIQEKKNAAIAKYKATVPQIVKVQPAGFDKPLDIHFRGPKNSREGMPFIGLQWAAVGAPEFCIQQQVTGRLMSIEEVVAAVKEQATAMYLSAPRTIQPAIPPPIDRNLSTGAWGDDTTDRIGSN